MDTCNTCEASSSARGPKPHQPKLHRAMASSSANGLKLHQASSSTHGSKLYHPSSIPHWSRLHEASSSTIGPKYGAASSTKGGNTESMDMDIDIATKKADDADLASIPIYESARKFRISKIPSVIGSKRTPTSEMLGLKEDLEYTTKFNQKYLEMIVKLRRENIRLEVDLALCKEDLEACKKEIRTLKAQTDWLNGLFMKS